MAGHSCAVGSEIERYVEAFRKSAWQDRVFYVCTIADDKLLARGRGHEDVQVMECNLQHTVELE